MEETRLLFIQKNYQNRPLYKEVKPESLDDIINISSKLKQFFKNLVKARKFLSFLFWGQAGCGKTSLAEVLLKEFKVNYFKINAIDFTTKEIKDIVKKTKQPFYFFIDEIFYLNKKQQEVFLNYLENKDIYLIATTTYHPYYNIIYPLLSRIKIIKLYKFTNENLRKLINIAFNKLNKKNTLSQDAINYLIKNSNNDARRLLNYLEFILYLNQDKAIINKEDIKEFIDTQYYNTDKQEQMYALLSAFHKSLRSSDTDAATYYFLRYINENYPIDNIFRRLITAASEDIGLADNNALNIALQAKEAFNFLGYPEGLMPIIQAIVYITKAKKDNSIKLYLNKMLNFTKKYQNLDIPKNIQNANNIIDKRLNLSKGYKNAHKEEVKDSLLPEEIDIKKGKIANEYFYKFYK